MLAAALLEAYELPTQQADSRVLGDGVTAATLFLAVILEQAVVLLGQPQQPGRIPHHTTQQQHLQGTIVQHSISLIFYFFHFIIFCLFIFFHFFLFYLSV